MTDFNEAIHDPSGSYDLPRDILEDDNLTKEQKIKLLEQWEYDARLLSTAEEENMPGDASNMLSRIHNALRSLESSEKS